MTAAADRGTGKISIHALREEGDARDPATESRPANFYPRPPRGGRHVASRQQSSASGPISIHALREEGDSYLFLQLAPPVDFYPRPPRGGRPAAQPARAQTRNFYPRPPRGGRLGAAVVAAVGSRISIHALREEGDTSSGPVSVQLVAISIHALREEGDEPAAEAPAPSRDFYPRPPRGGRRDVRWSADLSEVFLSTPSARRATTVRTITVAFPLVFLSTPSARRATCRLLQQIAVFCGISIHALREEGDAQ